MKLYTITQNVGGIIFTHYIVSAKIQTAVDKSCLILQNYVGVRFEQDVLNGKYLSHIDIQDVHITK